MNLAESFTKFFDNKKLNFKNSRINCNLDNYKDYFQEIFKRIFLPLYLPILSLVACLTIIKSKDDYKFEKYKFILFVIGVIVIIVSESFCGQNLILFPSIFIIKQTFGARP